MDTFGDKLRSEREERGLSIPAVARTLGVDDARLHALERNDFRALPEDASVLACLREYAACLEVDAELMIEDYIRERDACLRRLDQAVSTQQVASVAPAARPSALARQPTLPRWVVASGIAAMVVLGAWWMFSGDGAPSTPIEPAVVEPVVTRPAAVERPAAGPASTSSRAMRPVTRTGSATASGASRMSISDHGVGTAVDRRQLVGRSDRFAEGTQVWFWTRVESGSVGGRIEHVWLRPDGVEAARMSLAIGGAPWRTYSAKMLHPGSIGDWVVEARDAAGRVLARQDFACIR